MKFRIVSLISGLLLLPLFATAQTMSNSERRHVNTLVLDLLEEYERYASLYDEDARYYFTSLFADENVPVICDILGTPEFEESIPVSEYVRLMSAYSLITITKVRDVSKGKMRYDGKLWHIPVIFHKDLAYIDNNEFTFSVSDYFAKDFQMTMDVLYDPDYDQCLIGSINGVIQADRSFPEGRFRILRKDDVMSSRNQKYYSGLTVGGCEIEYDDNGIAIHPDENPEVRDIDVEVSTDTLLSGFNYDVVSYNFKTRNTRFKLRYDYAPFGIYNLSYKESDCDIDDRSDAMELGLDVGFCFPVGASSKMGFYFGAGLSLSNLYLTVDQTLSYNYLYPVQSGLLFDEGKIQYQIKSVEERVRYIDMVVPVYFELEHPVGRHVLISWNFGVKGYYALSADGLHYKMSAKQNGNVLNLATVPDAKGKATVAFLEPNSYARNKDIDLSAMVNLGLDVNIFKRRIYFSVRGGYEHGLMGKIYESKTHPYYSPYSSEKMYPVVYNPLEDEHIAVHSLISGVSFSRSAFWFSAGLKFKL